MLRSSRVQIFGRMLTLCGKKNYTSFISSTSVALNIVPSKVTTRNFNIVSHFAHRRAIVVSSYQSRFFSSYPSHTVVPMPALSPTMELGSISSWHLKEGDKFSPGQAICEVETDKAVVTYEATDEGYIAKILVGKGEIKVGEPMMITVTESEDVPSFASYSLTSTAAPSAPVPAAATAAAAAGGPAVTVAPPQAASTSIAVSGSRVLASPLAKKLAKESSLDLSSIFPGSGPNGRVIKDDVLQAVKNPPTVKASPPVTTAASATPSPTVAIPSVPTTKTTTPSKTEGIYEDFVLAPLADALASQFTVSKQTVPHYYLSTELNLTSLLALRAQFNSVLGKGEKEIGVLDMLLRAAALAMKQVPDANASWNDAGFVRRFDQIDINVVIGDCNSKAGMSLPLLRDVGSKGFKTIASEVAKFQSAEATSSTELLIGTFTVHNLGMFGIKSAAPIVLPPQACALGLGAIVDSVIPRAGAGKDGEEAWTVAPVIVATLSCDHRVIDGAVGAQWLSAFKALVETPTNMLL